MMEKEALEGLTEMFGGLVVDFELSEKLQAAGMPQNSKLYWTADKQLSFDTDDAVFSAPLAEEVGRHIPRQFFTLRVADGAYSFVDLMLSTMQESEIAAPNGQKSGAITLQRIGVCNDKTEANCRARGLLYIREKGMAFKWHE